MEEQMEERIAKLERSNRWMRIVLVAVVGIVGIVMFGGAAREGIRDEVRTKQLIIEDDNGNRRAELSPSSDGTGLNLYDENGIPRAILYAKQEEEGLILFDANGNRRADLSASSTGAILALFDENKTPRACLGIDPTDGATIVLGDKNCETIWNAP